MLTPQKKSWNTKHSLWKIILPIAISLWVAFSSCEKKQDKVDDKIQIEQNDSIIFQKKQELWLKYINENNFSEAIKIAQELEKLCIDTYKNNDPKNKSREIKKMIGIIFARQKNYIEAIKQYKKWLEAAIVCDNRQGKILLHTLIGESYRNLWEDTLVLENFFKARAIASQAKDLNKEEINNQVEVGTDLARWYLEEENNVPVAKAYRDKCIELNKLIDNKKNDIQISYDLWDLELHQNNKTKAKEYYIEWVEIAKKIEATRLLEVGYQKLKNRYLENNDLTKAREYRDLEDSLKDARINESSTNKVNELNIQYETEKKEQQISLQDAKIEKQSEEKKKMIRVIITALTVALWTGGLWAFAHKKKKEKEKQNAILTTQKEELILQKEEISAQKHIIERKNQSIHESIQAGKQVQEKIVLPKPEYIKKLFPESFVLFKPKDGVSGDFYRFNETKSGKKLFAAVDCTWHGIPGAFVSVSGRKILDDAIEMWLEKPNEILAYLDKEIIDLQSDEGEEDVYSKYGMDISLCSRDEKTKTLEYSGAVNSIYIIHKDKKEMTTRILNPNRKKIWYRFEWQEDEYKNESVEIHDKNSIIYLFSDGYQDQFGGKDGKKLKRNEFQKFIEQSTKQETTMAWIQKSLENKFEKRMGNEEQIDDILVMGIKV